MAFFHGVLGEAGSNTLIFIGVIWIPSFFLHEQKQAYSQTSHQSLFFRFLGRPYPPTPDPRLLHHPFVIEDDEIRPPPGFQVSPVRQAHHVRHIPRRAPHRPRDILTPGPSPGVPHALRQARAAADQSLRALEGDLRPSLPLLSRDLGVARIHTVR